MLYIVFLLELLSNDKSFFKSDKVLSKIDVLPEPGELTKFNAKIFFASKKPLFRAAKTSFF